MSQMLFLLLLLVGWNKIQQVDSETSACEQYQCATNWSLHNLEHTYESLINECNIHESYNELTKFSNISMSDLEQGTVDISYMKISFTYFAALHCVDHCNVIGYLQLTWLHLRQRVSMGWVRFRGAVCYDFWYESADFCRWNGGVVVFLFYFGCFAFPVLVILQTLNVCIFLKLLTKDTGTALYLHLAETFTDFTCNLVVLCVDCFLMSQAASKWQKSCQNDETVTLYKFGYGVKRFTVFWNQCFLTALCVDRFYAIMRPHKYNSILYHKKRAKKQIGLITLAAIVLHIPLFAIQLFAPVIGKWQENSNFRKTFIIVMQSFYTWAPVAPLSAQLCLGILLQKKFAAYMKTNTKLLSPNAKKRAAENKRKEREKLLLLVGTAGLNVCTSTVSLLTDALNSLFLYKTDIPLHQMWYINIFWALDPVLTFINGSVSVIFHVVLCKSYRLALCKIFLCCKKSSGGNE